MTPLELLDTVLPDLDPELGEAYVAGSQAAVWRVLESRGERVPSAYSRAFSEELNPYAQMYAHAAAMAQAD